MRGTNGEIGPRLGFDGITIQADFLGCDDFAVQLQRPGLQIGQCLGAALSH